MLEQHGSSLDQVVKCTAMLADIKDWGAMNQVYVTYFPKHFPARSAFGTTGLVMGARMELECWATVSRRIRLSRPARRATSRESLAPGSAL